MKRQLLNISLVLTVLLSLVSANLNAQCPYGGVQFPSGTFSNPGSTFTTVSTCIYGGEYQIYNVVSGTTYEWSYCTADGGNDTGNDLQLTLFEEGSGTFLAYSDDACGLAPKIVWTATLTGSVRLLTSQYFCTTNTSCQTLVWRGVAGGASGCNTGVAYSSYTPVCTGAQEDYAVCSYAGEYNTLTLVAGTSYVFGSSVATDYLTITDAANTILAAGTQPLNFTAPASGNYRVYIHLNSLCGTATTCRTPYVVCTAPVVGCNSGVPYFTYTPVCNSTLETYSFCTYAGEYNTLTLTSGTQYTFGSSVATDYITVTDNATNSILAAGNQPLNFTAPASGAFRVYYHLNAACATESSCREATVQCGSLPPPPPPANDDCSTATPVNLIDGAAPTTINASNLGATTSPAESSVLGYGAVWYAVTLSGSCNHNLAVNYCGTTGGVAGDVFIVYADCPLTTYTTTSNYNTSACGDGNYSLLFQNLPSGTYYIPVIADAGLLPLGNYTITFSSVLIDAIAPVPNLATLSAVTAECEVTSLTAPTATDNCAGTITGTHGATLPITASTTVTWTYNDGNGNTSTQTQQVIINDVTAPVANVATLAAVTAECEVTSLTAPTATDNCAGTITGTHGATLPITASTSITWTYTDGNGNSATQTQQVIINDVTAPVANAATLADVIAECEVTSLTAPTATDNCAGTITGTHGATLPITASTSITWTYTDGNGNSATQTQQVIINDVTAPVANVATLAAVTAMCEVTSLTAPTATDNCVGSITGTTAAILPITASTSITWTYTDGNGNSATQTQEIFIEALDATVSVVDNTITADQTGMGVTYQWVDCDNSNAEIVDETGVSFTAAQTGNYAVVVTYGACSVMSDCQLVEVSGLDHLNAMNIAVYPNPANDQITIETVTAGTIEIIDFTGRMVQKMNVEQGVNQVQVSNLSTGTYTVRLIGSTGVFNTQIVINRN
jgi:dihydropteroate synthase